ncbi:TniQ family protein [Streptomyces sp. H39-S7]|uniref:TniQ family protein n=1 Tax=Streptomyces sp. H39-S7 TaxID=3004357 RepID=UPI0022AE5D3C|nr:TniQ family protein [Streptomyces sp. H39-S7]MCZ4120252.1 TniQ family protein [Streptomyces sp. H39-S7]
MVKVAKKAGTRGRVWKPVAAHPRRVRLIAQESTGSFVSRLAAAHGMSCGELLDVVGAGTVAMEPQFTELYLNAAALERLADVSGHSRDVLQHTLPSLGAHRLLPDDGGPRWTWPQWQARGVFLVRACELCTASLRMPHEVYLVSTTRWRVCARHGRWLDNLREGGKTWLCLRAVPEVMEAHRGRMLLERRLGGGGRVLFADALHIAALWWNLPHLSPPVWGQRQARLQAGGGGDLRAAALVAYPEVADLARALAARERRRMRGSWTDADDDGWLNSLRGRLEDWQMPSSHAVLPLSQWAAQHSAPTGGRAPGSDLEQANRRPSRGRYRRLPATYPHGAPVTDAHLEELTCMPWRFGEDPPELDPAFLWSMVGQA